jgi:protease-4
MDAVRQMLVESREDILKNDRVKALMLNIESPGGAAVDADSIYHAVKAYKERYKVPVYAYVDGLCASGGMYVACAADKIYASEISLIGSVGVIIQPFVNVAALMDKIGVISMTLYAGKGKDDMNPLRAWKAGEQDNLQNIVEDYYTQFVNIVAENRPQLDKTKLIKEYGANIYPAAKATEYGYIDGHGLSYSEALKKLVEAAGIKDDNYQVFQMESKNWVTQLLKSSSPVLTGTIKHQIQLTPELDPALMNKFLYLYQPGI